MQRLMDLLNDASDTNVDELQLVRQEATKLPVINQLISSKDALSHLEALEKTSAWMRLFCETFLSSALKSE